MQNQPTARFLFIIWNCQNSDKKGREKISWKTIKLVIIFALGINKSLVMLENGPGSRTFVYMCVQKYRLSGLETNYKLNIQHDSENLNYPHDA